MRPIVIGFYGKSNMGKTSLIIRLIQKLSQEGYKIASIKQTKKPIGVDCIGKDTWKHADAGAELVVFSSPVETDFLLKKKLTSEDILQQIATMDSYDCILVEGATDPHIPKIRIGNIKKRLNTIGEYQGDFNALHALVKK